MLHLLCHVQLSHFYFFLVNAKNFSGSTIPFYLSYYLIIIIIILPNYMYNYYNLFIQSYLVWLVLQDKTQPEKIDSNFGASFNLFLSLILSI